VSRLRSSSGAVEFDSIVFDLFHTLVDPQEHASAGLRRLDAVAQILALPVADIELWWQQRVDEFVSEPISPVDALVELARSRRIVLSPGAVAEIDRAMGSAQDGALAEPVAGVLETLRLLGSAEVKRAVLSNAHVRDVRTFADSPLADVVDDVCVSCFTGLVKPDRAAYLQALERIGSEAHRSVYMGDGGGGELKGARDAGFGLVVAVTGPVQRGGWRSSAEQQRIEIDADLVIGDISELGALLEP